MNKLLHAGFRRLFRNMTFWITAVSVAAFSLINTWNNARSYRVMAETGYVHTLDDYFFNAIPYAGLLFSIFISLFLGTEYSDGTIRNKLCVGHTRRDIYLSNFIISLSGSLCLLALFFLCEIPGFFTIGPLKMGMSGLLICLLIAAGFTAAFAAIFTLTDMLCTNKALSVVLSLIVWLALTLAASGLNDRLAEPETNGGMAMINGVFTMMEDAPNPLYVSGTVRTVMEFALELLPTGQGLLMHDASIVHPFRQLLLGTALTAVLLVLGVSVFRKKDIR